MQTSNTKGDSSLAKKVQLQKSLEYAKSKGLNYAFSAFDSYVRHFLNY